MKINITIKRNPYVPRENDADIHRGFTSLIYNFFNSSYYLDERQKIATGGLGEWQYFMRLLECSDG